AAHGTWLGRRDAQPQPHDAVPVSGLCCGRAGRAIDAVLALASLSTSLGTTAGRGSGAHNIVRGMAHALACSRPTVLSSGRLAAQASTSGASRTVLRPSLTARSLPVRIC